MTRVFLAAGVAALAIAAPASAGPHGGGGGRDRQAQVERQSGGGGGQRAQRATFAAPRMQQAQRFASFDRPQRAERMQMARPEPRMAREQARPARVQPQERVAARQQQVRPTRVQPQERMTARQQVRPTRVQPQERMTARQQQVRPTRVQPQERMAARQQLQTQRVAEHQQQVQNRMAARQQIQANQQTAVQGRLAERQQLRTQANNLLVERQALRADRIANANAFRASRLAALTTPTVRTRTVAQVVAPAQVVRYVGQPVSTVTNYVPLMALPSSVNYLYPDTPDYYYQYGGGYLYQVDRSSSLISALIPLLAGGFLPGTYLPQPYMNSYVPSYYGLDSFYPSSYGYGYPGYSNICNRYEYGVVYQVDCVTGMVMDVIPLYAGGYGVGQMLPSAYDYYNVPMQYRSMYYPTADASYWYAPGAIYQYDPNSSLITSVAALMSPGFSVGQPLPAGYGVYNVPYDYRATYYDTPNAWYRYNNGYIYQIDPTTQLVTAIVASLLRA
jgi:hypothetical protein